MTTIARILKPYRGPNGRWHVPAEVDLPGGAAVHLIVSAPEDAITSALQMATDRVGAAIKSGTAAALTPALPPPRGGGVVAGYHDYDMFGFDDDEVAGWWSDLGNTIGKALTGPVGQSIIKGVTSYIPYVGPALAQTGIMDAIASASGKALISASGKRRRPRRRRRPSVHQRRAEAHRRKGALARKRLLAQKRAKRARKLKRAAAIRDLKRHGFRISLSHQRRGGRSAVRQRPRRVSDGARAARRRKPRPEARASALRALLQAEHGRVGAQHVLRLAKAVRLLERATRGDRTAMAMIDHTTKRAAQGDRRAQRAAGYFGALVTAGDPLANILRDLGSRRAGYRPAMRQS